MTLKVLKSTVYIDGIDEDARGADLGSENNGKYLGKGTALPSSKHLSFWVSGFRGQGEGTIDHLMEPNDCD